MTFPAISRYVGGVFWWYFWEDMVPKTKPLWTTLNNAIQGQPPPPPPPLPSPQTVGTVPAIVPTTTPPPPIVRKCRVPRLKRKTLKTAKRAIRHANCTVGKIKKRPSNKVKRGRVISQKPKAGTQLPNGAKVKLTVSRG
jgi:PASTA domain